MSHLLLLQKEQTRRLRAPALPPQLPETRNVRQSKDWSHSDQPNLSSCHRPVKRRKRESGRRRRACYVSSRRRPTWFSSPASLSSHLGPRPRRRRRSPLSPDHAVLSSPSSRPGPPHSRERLTGRRGTTAVSAASALRAGNALARSLVRSLARRPPRAGSPFFSPAGRISRDAQCRAHLSGPASTRASLATAENFTSLERWTEVILTLRKK